jgi:uncharacterized protein (TIRG00374 family)
VLKQITNLLNKIPERRRKKIFTSLRYLFALVALAWVVTQISWRRAIALLISIELWVVIQLLVIMLAELLSYFFALYILLNYVHPTRFISAVNIDLVVRFINHLLPSRLAGRSAAPFVIKQSTDIGWNGAIAVAGVHTAIHALLYGAVALVSLIFAYTQLPVGLLVVIALSVGLYLIVGIILMIAGRHMELLNILVNSLAGLFELIPVFGNQLSMLLGKTPQFTSGSGAIFRELTNEPRIWMFYLLGWGGRMAVFPAIRMWILLGVFGAQGTIPFVMLPFYLVMAYSVTLLPLTPGGIGVAEASATLVFVSLGIPEEIIVPIIIIDRFLGVYLPTLFGWFPISRMDLQWGRATE